MRKGDPSYTWANRPLAALERVTVTTLRDDQRSMAAPLPFDALPIQRIEWMPDLGLLIRVDNRPALIWLLDGMAPALERCVLAHELRHAADAQPTTIEMTMRSERFMRAPGGHQAR
jgi:hypothetical protein